MSEKLTVATNNECKILEIREILGGRYDALSLKESGIDLEIEESGGSFYENALIKAKAAALVTGAPALADDSGLEVMALGGAPGIYSARYAGEHGDSEKNNEKLLSALKNIDDRRARFVCCMVLYRPDGKIYTANGYAYGKIADAPAGKGGFGYDPLFISDDLGISFGEAAPEAKNGVSHRARALKKLTELL